MKHFKILLRKLKTANYMYVYLKLRDDDTDIEASDCWKGFSQAQLASDGFVLAPTRFQTLPLWSLLPWGSKRAKQGP